MTANRYPEIEGGTVIVPWGPGYDHGINGADGLDVVVVANELDMRPEGGTVASLELQVADGTEPEVLNMIGVELTQGDLMALGNWAYDRVISAGTPDETEPESIQYLQVAPVMHVDDGLMQCETKEDMRWVAMWTIYARVFTPTGDGFVKAEALRDYDVANAIVENLDAAKDMAVRMAHLLSAGRWPIEVIDPRDA